MSDFKDKERLDALRERLYARGDAAANMSTPRTTLTPQAPVDVARGWAGTAPVTKPVTPMVQPATVPPATAPLTVPPISEVTPPGVTSTRRRYRTIVMVATLVMFIVAVGVSSLYLFFGGNQISGRNIDLAVSGPNAVAGGDLMKFDVSITNKNVVAMEGVTLVIQYPPGTRSTGDSPRDLYEERLPVADIAAEESRTIPLEAVIFGEENEAKEVKVSVDYRVTGSNATFFKDTEPLAFSINSSPVVLRIEAVDKISPGQEFDVKIIVESNAQAPLENVLISASYPEGFRFVRSTPEPSYRQTEWTIDTLPPNGREEIVIRGVASGLSEESSVVRLQAGTPRTDNQFIIGSILAQNTHTFTVERPFVDVGVTVNNDTDGDIVLPSGTQVDAVVTVTNKHTVPLYDMNVRIKLDGTAFRASQLRVTEGVYDATNNEIRFDVSGRSELSRVLPGERREFRFQLSTDDEASTARLGLDASVYARRVSEANVPEELVGAVDASVRYASVPKLARQIDRLTGPVPPVVGKETLYTLTIAAEAGANDVTGGTVVTSLPQYARWLDAYEGPGTVSFNPINKELRWSVGEVKAKQRAVLSFQVGFTPSVLQVGSTPVMMNRLDLTVTDRFTGSPLSADAPPLTTSLPREAGYESDNGVVVEAE